MTDTIDTVWLKEQFAQLLSRFGRSLHYVSEVGSTNSEAFEAALAGAADGALWIADKQTHGRGSHARNWFSPGGLNVYMSLVVRPSVTVCRLPGLTLCAGLAVAQAIETFVHRATVGIKWPNDVLINGRKVAGILVESGFLDGRCEFVVVGFGINVHQRNFDASLERQATSIRLHEDRGATRQRVILETLRWFEKRLAQFERDDGDLVSMMKPLRERDVTRGRVVQVGNAFGVAIGIASDGRLNVKMDDGERLVEAGRVQVVGAVGGQRKDQG